MAYQAVWCALFDSNIGEIITYKVLFVCFLIEFNLLPIKLSVQHVILLNKMNDGPEYLHFNPKIDIPNYNDLVENSQVISPKFLIPLLKESYEELTQTPGPNLTLRQLWAPDWLGWWIDFLGSLPSQNTETVHSDKLKPNLATIKGAVEKYHLEGKSSGLLLMGGGEGTEAHRHAQDWVAKHVDIPILLIEHPEYVRQKQRGGRFLPLAIGLSMWAHHPRTGLISLVPRNEFDLPPNHFYQIVHNQTGARHHFASADDPNRLAKINRGQIEDFCTIPTLDVPHTTERTKKLFPGGRL